MDGIKMANVSKLVTAKRFYKQNKGVIHMTTKQLIKYAGEKLKNYDSVFFFVNTEKSIKTYAPNGEKYGLCYINTNKLISSANNISEAKEIIDEFVNYCKERDVYYKSEAKKYGYTY